MTILIDMVGAAILTSTIFLGIMNINLGMHNETDKSVIEQIVQSDLINLERLTEFDLLKVGHKISKQDAVITADTSRFRFKSNLYDLAGDTVDVEYELGALVTSSKNPRDRILYRREDGATVRISYRISQFRFSYYNKDNAQMSTPVTGLALDSIKAIRLQMRVEFPEPVDTSRTGTAPYLGQSHVRLFRPVNMQ